MERDIFTTNGKSKKAAINSLINNKIAAGDIINYEVQGGAKKLIAKVVKSLDQAINTNVDPIFKTLWNRANSRFAKHAQLFRGKALSNILKGEDFSQIAHKMNSPSAIAKIRQALSKTKEGKKLFGELARYKLDEMIGKNLVDSTSQQANFGRFAKLLEKGQNREIAKQLLGKEAFTGLERLQKVSGRISDTSQKFFNASRSGVHVGDMALASQIMKGIGNIISGNPWPLLKGGGLLLGGKQLAKLMSDPKFIRSVEDAILKSSKPTSQTFINSGLNVARTAKRLLGPTAAAAITQNDRQEQ